LHFVLRAGHLSLVLGSAVDTWATVAVAVGTIGAVAYALFRDLIVTPRRRPRLELGFDPGGNDRLVVATADGLEAAHVRLRVANRAGKDTADDVVVMVTELRTLGDAEETAAESKPIGLPLTWSGTNPPLTVSSVHPGSERHIDLLHVDWPACEEVEIARRWPERAPLQLDLSPRPAGGRDLLDPGRHEISVEIRARNADAICFAILVAWDGEWSGKAAMWEHLRVDAPRRVR
jgi:hypothetical protein